VVIHTDETSLKVIQVEKPTSYIWAYRWGLSE